MPIDILDEHPLQPTFFMSIFLIVKSAARIVFMDKNQKIAEEEAGEACFLPTMAGLRDILFNFLLPTLRPSFTPQMEGNRRGMIKEMSLQ